MFSSYGWNNHIYYKNIFFEAFFRDMENIYENTAGHFMKTHDFLEYSENHRKIEIFWNF